MTGVRRWHDPFVMCFMQRPVDFGMVQTPVNPVNTQIGETNEQWKLEEVVKGKRSFGWSIVELAVATDLKKEQECGEE